MHCSPVMLSCGVLILNRDAELLLCHATGTPRWDIPKGALEPGETPLDAALRETAEETGLQFMREHLLDLGRMPYLSGKDLHLFATLTQRLDLAQCHCRSHFIDTHGRSQPEMDAFAWVPFDAVPQRCGKHLAALLTQRVSLAEVLSRLVKSQ